MNYRTMPKHTLLVSNDETGVFMGEAIENLMSYIQCMSEHMLNSFPHDLNDKKYVDNLIREVILKTKINLKKNRKGNVFKIQDVYLDEIHVNLRQVCNLMSNIN